MRAAGRQTTEGSTPSHLLQLIDSLRGLDSHLEKVQYPSDDVHNSVGDFRGGLDVDDVSADVVELEGFD